MRQRWWFFRMVQASMDRLERQQFCSAMVQRYGRGGLIWAHYAGIQFTKANRRVLSLVWHSWPESALSSRQLPSVSIARRPSGPPSLLALSQAITSWMHYTLTSRCYAAATATSSSWSDGSQGMSTWPVTKRPTKQHAQQQLATPRHSVASRNSSALRYPTARRQLANAVTCRASIKRAARKVWSRSPRYERTNLLAPDVLLSPYQHALSSLPRKHTSLITQLITGHIPLAVFLHKIGAEDSPTCPCCHESPETIAHFVIHCPVHRLARAAMFAGLHPASCNLTTLLSSPKNHPRLLTFIARTDRLRSVYGRITEINAATAQAAPSA